MALNPAFNLFNNVAEQTLLQDLTTEAIQIYGHLIKYLPRNDGNIDELFFEDPTSDYSSAIDQEMYIVGVEGFEGDAEFLSKFGVEIRDQIKLAVSRPPFATNVGTPAGIPRPREGDLIWMPLMPALFEIKFVEHELPFYQLGALQFWLMTIEKFEYSQERFNTGISGIDDIQTAKSTDLLEWQLVQEDGFALLQEDGFNLTLEEFDLGTIDPLSQNEIFQTDADTIIDFSEDNPFSEGDY